MGGGGRGEHIHSYHKYLLRHHYVPGTVLSTVKQKRDENLCKEIKKINK